MTECGACGGGMAAYLETRDCNRRLSQERFRYLRCARCGLVSLANVPHDLGRYYPPDYHQIPADQAAIEAGVAHERYKIDLVSRFASGGRLLEIGPSWGAFCVLAQRAGFAVEAIESDAACCSFLSTTLAIRSHRSDDAAEAFARAEVPDVVAAWHVLEHLREPWRLLERLAARLAPGAVVVLATPNPGALQFAALGRYWAHLDAPRHLHLVPPSVLRERAAAVGLEQIFFTTADAGSIRWNRFGWRMSLANLASGAAGRRCLSVAGRLASWLLSPVEDGSGLGAAYTAVFRKAGSPR